MGTTGRLIPRVYLDTNVYSAIANGRIAIDVVARFRAAVAGREIVCHLSLTDVDELLGGWHGDREAARHRLRVARDVAGFDDMLKQPSDLLADAIRAYAAQAPDPSPLLPPDQSRAIVPILHGIADGDTSLDNLVATLNEDVRRLKDEFCTPMVRAQAQALADLEQFDVNERSAMTFAAYWEATARDWADGFVAPLDCADACRARGLDGLLDVRAVRICVGVTASWVHTQLFDDVAQPRQPHRNDGYDLWHALLASAADVFVTEDRQLAELLARVPVADLAIARSLAEVFAE